MIAINFASRNFRLIERITIGLVAGSVALFLAAGAMVWTNVSLRRDISLTEQKLKESEAEDERLRPVLAERDLLVRDLSAMSGLLESRRFSWTRLFSSIEGVAPIGVAMKSVDFDPRDHALSLEGSAESPEALRNLVIALERSTSFGDPYLKRQSLEKGSISFNVVAVYHEGAGVAAVKGHK